MGSPCHQSLLLSCIIIIAFIASSCAPNMYGQYKCVHMWHLYHHNADQSAFKYSPGAVEVAESKYEEAKQELEEVISELQDD